jgi:uncharacterized glyoxalase superfamily protein PhnB
MRLEPERKPNFRKKTSGSWSLKGGFQMFRTTAFVILTLLFSFSTGQLMESQKENHMSVNKITAVLLVEEVEPCVKFWVDRLGFEKTMEVPDGNKMAFAMLQKGNIELMYQTFDSVKKDDPNFADIMRKGPTFLYVEVSDINETIAALKGVPVVMPLRTTFYGAKEIGVKDPGNHIITFAQVAATPAH